MFPTLGVQELIIILLIVVFIFGAKRIPEIGSGLGKGIRSFRKAMKSVGAEDDEEEAKAELAEKVSSEKKKATEEKST